MFVYRRYQGGSFYPFLHRRGDVKALYPFKAKMSEDPLIMCLWANWDLQNIVILLMNREQAKMNMCKVFTGLLITLLQIYFMF